MLPKCLLRGYTSKLSKDAFFIAFAETTNSEKYSTTFSTRSDKN